MSDPRPPHEADLPEIRAKLARENGRRHWRSLSEAADPDAFREARRDEFAAPGEPPWQEPLSRRGFLQFMAASMALAGLSGCAKGPAEKIIPYVIPPEEIVPGRPLFYATALALDGYARGVRVESHMGRPTKVEGNPLHPDSLGATDAISQAALLGLVDPDRAQAVLHRGLISTWGAFLTALGGRLDAERATGGAGLRILTGTVTSPTLAGLLRRTLERFPEAAWHRWQPIHPDARREASRLAFGEPLDAVYRFAEADVVVSFGADFLSTAPGSLRYARHFSDRRAAERMNRLYVAESAFSITGAKADHRLAAPPSAVEALARAVAARVGVAVEAPRLPEAHARWAEAAAADLAARRGASLVLAGAETSPALQALAHAANAALGNFGRTVVAIAPVEADPVDHAASLEALVRSMRDGLVGTLLILGGNPAFDAPPELEFGDALARVAFKARLGAYEDETSYHCDWHVPEAHALESWGDLRAFDGTATIQQPLIDPLFNGRTAIELVSFAAGAPSSARDAVRARWAEGRSDFENFWETSLRNGVVEGTAEAPRAAGVRRFDVPPAPEARDAVEILFRPDPSIRDGAHANNGWLQELPKPLTKLTWDNALHLSPALAERLGVRDGDLVRVRVAGLRGDFPALILPGHADGAATLHFGHGRRRAGRVGTGTGFDAYALRPRGAWAAAAALERTGKKYALARTQEHQAMENRDLVRVGTLDEFEKNPRFAQKHEHKASLYPDREYDGYAWGMVVNLNACTGCGACVVACNSENNIPVVGKDQVLRGREMQWIRIDTYFEGPLDAPAALNQPMLCMHCEHAPCEPVCPVGATTHSSEGLNEMTYNRCVGTRYCSNNCPYKVRRFNFHDYNKDDSPSQKAAKNPDVTVRSRGVMEKCTYCVQRISAARIEARKEGRRIRDGEVVTACQGACASRAIVFGDLNDKDGAASKMRRHPLNYGLLAELNTRPRTTYWAALRNPNPGLADG